MATQKDDDIILSLYKTIIHYGEIRRHDLLAKTNTSITQFNRVKSVMEERYENMIIYNRKTKVFTAPKILAEMMIEIEEKTSQTKLFDVEQ